MEFQNIENTYHSNHGGYKSNNDGYNNGGNNYRKNGNYENKRKPPENMYTVYTDGGCMMNQNPPIGAWAFVDPKTGYSKAEAVENTTNNKMELTAVIKALDYLKSKLDSGEISGKVEIKSDSQYVVNGAAFWIKKWKTNNWKRIDKDGNIVGDVLNVDLWKQIDAYKNAGMDIWWTHVRGHSGDMYNEKCDSLVKDRMHNFRNN